MLEDFVNIRGGLPGVIAKLKKEPCIIGYLGASVTAQRDGFRPIFHQTLCNLTEQCHKSVTAALGSNGSICNVFIMDELILKHQPVVCFIECSVADLSPYTPISEVGPVMEGIILKLLQAGVTPCLVHLYRSDRIYKGSDVIALQEEVAERYAIPSINLGAYFEELVNSKLIDTKVFIPDAVHTSAAGAAKYSELLIQGIKIILSKAPKMDRVEQSNFDYIKPIYKRSFFKTSLVASEDSWVKGGEAIRGIFRLYYPYLEIGFDSKLQFSFDQELIGMMLVIGPHSGEISVEVNSSLHKYSLYDQWCDFERVKALIFNEPIPSGSDVRVTLLSPYSMASEVEKKAHRLKVVSCMLRHTIPTNLKNVAVGDSYGS